MPTDKQRADGDGGLRIVGMAIAEECGCGCKRRVTEGKATNLACKRGRCEMTRI